MVLPVLQVRVDKQELREGLEALEPREPLALLVCQGPLEDLVYQASWVLTGTQDHKGHQELKDHSEGLERLVLKDHQEPREGRVLLE